MAIIYKHRKAPIPVLPRAAARCLQPLIERFLAKKPEDRFATVAAAVEGAFARRAIARTARRRMLGGMNVRFCSRRRRLRGSTTPLAHWRELLVDHANCEKKAASTALALMFAYPEDRKLTSALVAPRAGRAAALRAGAAR